MCSQNRSSGSFWLALLFGVLLFSARTIWADETGLPPSGPAGSSESMTPELLPLSGSATSIETWPDYDTASASFQAALDQLALSWPKYSRLQVSLGISFSDFPEYIENLIKLYEDSAAALTKEREDQALKVAADKKALEYAERSRDAWRTGAFVAGGLALLFGGVAALALIF